MTSKVLSMHPKISRIVIAGGGTAGWMTAAALSKVMGTERFEITLVESPDIGSVGVGEATIPPIINFNALLGVDEADFMRATKATFKVGIEFRDWRRIGESYFHPFGLYGLDMDHIQFSHFWMRFAQFSNNLDFGRFNLETMAARSGRFGKISDRGAFAPKLNYAFQFDAALYAAYLRQYSEARGVRRVEGNICDVNQDPLTGQVATLRLDDERILTGDFFIDCTGFRGLLISRYKEARFTDWSEFLPCNRAVAVSSSVGDGETPSFTVSTARPNGWQWRIPLQHRFGNGLVFCDAYLSEDQAMTELLSSLDTPAIKEPISLKFTAGRRATQWHSNVVAIGLASGFLEPLESTSIHLIQMAITKLLGYFPRSQSYEIVCERFNEEMRLLYDSTRDFLIAHYCLTERDDTEFWKANKARQLPETLLNKLEWFRRTSIVPEYGWELFKQSSWFAVLMGQGLIPEDYHPIADKISVDELKLRMSRIRTLIQDQVNLMPKHADYIAHLAK